MKIGIVLCMDEGLHLEQNDVLVSNKSGAFGKVMYFLLCLKEVK